MKIETAGQFIDASNEWLECQRLLSEDITPSLAARAEKRAVELERLQDESPFEFDDDGCVVLKNPTHERSVT